MLKVPESLCRIILHQGDPAVVMANDNEIDTYFCAVVSYRSRTLEAGRWQSGEAGAASFDDDTTDSSHVSQGAISWYSMKTAREIG